MGLPYLSAPRIYDPANSIYRCVVHALTLAFEEYFLAVERVVPVVDMIVHVAQHCIRSMKLPPHVCTVRVVVLLGHISHRLSS